MGGLWTEFRQRCYMHFKESQGSMELEAVRDSEVQYLAKAVFQGISSDKSNA